MKVLKPATVAVVVALVVYGVVALWPNLELILTLGAAVLVIGGYIAAITWSDRRRRRGEEASTAEPTAVPFHGWHGGSPF